MEETERPSKDTTPRWKAVGPPYLLTRDELLDELRARGYSMSERQLKSWVSYGILPRPIRRIPAGATERVARVLYPVWMIRIISELLGDVTYGATIDQLRESAPLLIKIWEGSENNLSSISISTLSGAGTVVPFGSGSGLTITPPEDITTGVPVTPSGSTTTALPRVPRALQRAAWEYAADFTEKHHGSIVGATLILRIEDGTEVSIEVKQPPAGGD